ncbi:MULTISPECIES: FAD-dependent oxidoreductase [Aneurinibacillus]|uniref:FAD-dependent oxidoreductase n=1 Tax=Aneurinibacillus thermoaerophilus TaxID=143495 RepID=A0A1G8BLP7_ANETH|nr:MULTISPECIES: FAD-dependent oxidoreductase [Aneurinibacillus]AMA73389.1 sarcosine oxidase subunit alpha [Aneurinibacillus sp. XH2]MED0676051.1 FAD-dependent oxidoreductase [Aneurinibacillus thermoaerophilus]MED0681109.1 FAD-dependent oxidoreductase [Aneurinibacillus thermoaerophilus]MED0736334.1 FAD-dependent oxidoreductase [Aneurinibacillus thermoaerophilus]MED0758448.1 FAD-dependent oxidoreductase [Aneurinibacillus thermoaerophilus]
MSELVIIGAGPAGLAASIAARECGLKVTLIDEFIKPGGRLLGQLYQERDGTWWNGIKETDKLVAQAEKLGVEITCGISVYHLNKHEHGWLVHTNHGSMQAPYVLLATGAAEYHVPMPGWTLPGVMSVGAAQVMTNVHRVKVGKKGMIIGANILSFAIMHELQLADLNIACMVLPPKNEISKSAAKPMEVMKSLLRASHLAPSPILRFGSRLLINESLCKLALRFLPKKGMSVWGIPIHLRKAAIEIVGNQQVEGVKVVDITMDGEPIKGTEEIVQVDFVCISGGLYPLAELAAVAGCPFHYIPELGGHIPQHNERMETPLKGLYVAGNITGIEGAKVAIAQGFVAGYSIAEHTGASRETAKRKLEEAMKNVKDIREKAIIQFYPNVKENRDKLYGAYQCI